MLSTLFIITAILLLIIKIARPFIYDFFITNMTTKWYASVLDRLDNDSHILDIGIGTGKSLLNNRSKLLEKNISVFGLDYDESYVSQCKKLIAQESRELRDKVTVVHCSIYTYNSVVRYDAAYFSGSLMIMPDPIEALKHVGSMLKEKGKIYITQTFEQKENKFLEFIKPLLKYLTSIDFGNVTYKDKFVEAVKKANFEILEDIDITPKNSFKDRAMRLVVLEKKTN
eukprot:TRINITY_DN1693_c2_g1_i1.p1 TRINITY_DN1693_c2_g1~~TRINITY_DN1693_c2_g1_i1.p1  ORF type:complete len:227 (+),score=56.63 TRINITY_DN1693_c2_g1_i1:4-684(+)